VRDLVLNEAMKRLAAEAATRFSSLVATGEEIPFDLAGDAGPDSLFYSYVPLTGQFVHERERELRSLPAFGPACDAVDDAGVAAPYLEARGQVVPSDPQERAARMLTIFIASLWDGSTDFALDRKRLDEALAGLGAEARGLHEADVLIAPIVGLRMPLNRLQLPHGVRIVRADTIEAPADAMRSEGMGRAAWEPQFLALAEQSGESGGPAEAMRQLRELISVMRLFKAGGVGLGPFAFAPTGEGQWRRISTGAPATRPGGYELSEREAVELADLAHALEARPDPDKALAWAVGRFEMGCERATALEGLSDHLLALRAVLEGQGPVGASLPMRAAALIADDSHDRVQARERVEHALELERTLMNGDKPDSAVAPSLAKWMEGGVRIMLRDAALGELGADISTAADESLIATGLEAGDAEIAATVQDIPDPVVPIFETEAPEPEQIQVSRTLPSPVEPIELSEEDYMEQDTRIMEPIPAEDEIRITAAAWLDEVEVEAGPGTLEWPAVHGEVGSRERLDTPRVKHLFQVPEDADWDVRELNYDHYRRAG
jgi:hypothetical protein